MLIMIFTCYFLCFLFKLTTAGHLPAWQVSEYICLHVISDYTFIKVELLSSRYDTCFVYYCCIFCFPSRYCHACFIYGYLTKYLTYQFLLVEVGMLLLVLHFFTGNLIF
jgi:hypothetical protein